MMISNVANLLNHSGFGFLCAKVGKLGEMIFH